MTMNKMVLLAVTLALGFTALASDNVYATGAQKHDDAHPAKTAIGGPGHAEDATRTVSVTMKETVRGDMVFEPGSIDVRHGETIRFTITNSGALDHEFVMDTQANVIEHKTLMQRFPEMIHEEANAIRLEPGQSHDLIWTFSNIGEFEFACLIPGHYESGMYGPITVTDK